MSDPRKAFAPETRGRSEVYLQESNPAESAAIPEKSRTIAEKPEIPAPMQREQIAPKYAGEDFNPQIWRQGIVLRSAGMFLFVTLDKKGFADNHKYSDGFRPDGTFGWQSQNRTKQGSAHGRVISGEDGRPIHLFVRHSAKTKGKATPFNYCGTVRRQSWTGEKPISVVFEFDSPELAKAAKDFGEFA